MKVLITGGAGFIGSNLVEALLADERVELVRVLDNLATGSRQNLAEFEADPRFEFVEGDIRDFSVCKQAAEGVSVISHQAALGSVPRSIHDPITTNEVNITGTVHIYTAAKELGIQRVVYAASSSTYGDSPGLPKVEHIIGNPLSPYAVTKYVMELYARVYADLYGIQFVGLRYFNVFGPKQNPQGPYAAVIPLFVKSLLSGEAPVINGDGSISRDFTFVQNAVQANLRGIFTDNPAALNQVYNIAFGQRTTLTELYQSLKETAGSDLDAIYGAPRKGDIQHSLADISKARNLLGYDPKFSMKDGLKITFEWYQNHLDRL